MTELRSEDRGLLGAVGLAMSEADYVQAVAGMGRVAFAWTPAVAGLKGVIGWNPDRFERNQKRIGKTSLDQLLRRRCGGRMRCDAEVLDAAPVVREDDQDEHDLEAHGGDREEVDRDEFDGVTREERPPGERRRLTPTYPICLHGLLGDLDAELAKFTHDAWGAPGRVGIRHRADQAPDRLRHGWTRDPAATAQVRPMASEALLLPGGERSSSSSSRGP